MPVSQSCWCHQHLLLSDSILSGLFTGPRLTDQNYHVIDKENKVGVKEGLVQWKLMNFFLDILNDCGITKQKPSTEYWVIYVCCLVPLSTWVCEHIGYDWNLGKTPARGLEEEKDCLKKIKKEKLYRWDPKEGDTAINNRKMFQRRQK